MKKKLFALLSIVPFLYTACGSNFLHDFYCSSSFTKLGDIEAAQGISWSKEQRIDENGKFNVHVYVANKFFDKEGNRIHNNSFDEISVIFGDNEGKPLETHVVDLAVYDTFENSISEDSKEVLTNEDFHMKYTFDVASYYPGQRDDPMYFEVLYKYHLDEVEKTYSMKFCVTYVRKMSSDFAMLGGFTYYISDGKVPTSE